MTHYAIELDICPAYGWQGGPEGDTLVTPLANRYEYRNAETDRIQHRYTLPFANIQSAAYMEELKSAWVAMHARMHSFLVKDWLDFTATNEALGNAPSGSTAVQLYRNYTWGSVTRTRLIRKPVTGAVISQNGTPKAGTLDTETGLFTPSTSWSAGQPLTWTGEFRVPVRFDNDFMPFSIDNAGPGGHIVNGSVDLLEDLSA